MVLKFGVPGLELGVCKGAAVRKCKDTFYGKSLSVTPARAILLWFLDASLSQEMSGPGLSVTVMAMGTF